MIKLLPYILFEKYINIVALEIASPGNRHYANYIGTLLFPMGADSVPDDGCLDREGINLQPTCQPSFINKVLTQTICIGW